MPDKPTKRWGKSRSRSSNGHRTNGSANRSRSSTWFSDHQQDSGYQDSGYQADRHYPASDKLRGQVALVVGEADNTSKELAIGLAEMGADLTLIYFNGADEAADTIARQVKSCGRHCLTISGQEPGEQFSQEVIGKIVDRFGRLDIFIDCSRRASTTNGRSHNGGSKTDAPLRNHFFPRMRLMKAALSVILADKGDE